MGKEGAALQLPGKAAVASASARIGLREAGASLKGLA